MYNVYYVNQLIIYWYNAERAKISDSEENELINCTTVLPQEECTKLIFKLQ